MAFAIKLQSPAFDNDTNGEEIEIPVNVGGEQGSSVAAHLALPGGENEILDLAMFRKTIQLTGVLTQKAAEAVNLANPVHYMTMLQRIREPDSLTDTAGSTAPWSLQTATGNWGDSTLESDEQDASESRVLGRCRLIYDTKWDPGSGGSFRKYILYGTIRDVSFPQRAASSFRTRIPFGISFLVGRVASGQEELGS